jgi:hypothetical protein
MTEARMTDIQLRFTSTRLTIRPCQTGLPQLYRPKLLAELLWGPDC